MARKRHTPDEIVAKLRQGDVLVAQGQAAAETPWFDRSHHPFVPTTPQPSAAREHGAMLDGSGWCSPPHGTPRLLDASSRA